MLFGEPELVNTPGLLGSDAKLLVRDVGGGVWISTVTVKNDALEFSDLEPLLLADSGQQLRISGGSSPAAIFILQPELSPAELAQQAEKSLHVITASHSTIRLHRLVAESSHQVVHVRSVSGAVSPRGRPAPVWVTFDDTNEANGALHIYAAGTDGIGVVLKGRYKGSFDSAGAYDQGWVLDKFGIVDLHKVFAMAAVFEMGADEQPRLLEARQVLDDEGNPKEGHGGLVQRPRPENIFDSEYRGFKRLAHAPLHDLPSCRGGVRSRRGAGRSGRELPALSRAGPHAPKRSLTSVGSTGVNSLEPHPGVCANAASAKASSLSGPGGEIDRGLRKRLSCVHSPL